MKGLFITFEGTEGCGKSTQIALLADRLHKLNYRDVIVLREPGGTPIGEEIRHTLKHSQQNHAMTAEAELLLMNASRAQLVREIIRPALAAGKIILCDRFYDSSIAYQGYGRELDLPSVKNMIDFAVGDTRPNLTLLLSVPVEISEARRAARKESMLFDMPVPDKKVPLKLPFAEPARDRMEEADRDFFERVAKGFKAIAAAEPNRVRVVDSSSSVENTFAKIWELVQQVLPKTGRW
ncbi:MAG TPA: dTMP kinase [Verrucomicrobiae bacterium]|jgi:dTMP kinase|nr:dTMP kinase [Verrucomicrobiae bacterium]